MSRAPRVLQVIPLDLSATPNGTSIRALHIARVIARRFDSTVVSGTPEGAAVAGGEFARHLRVSRRRRGALGTLVRTARGHSYVTSRFAWELPATIEAESFDVAYIHHPAGWGLWRALRGRLDARRVVIDLHNDDHQVWLDRSRRESRLVLRRLAALYARRAAADLRSMAAGAHSLVCVSDDDAASIARLLGSDPGVALPVVPNGVDVESFTSPGGARRGFCFTGGLDVRMNQIAVRRLLEEDWPAVRRRLPDATLTIAGRNPPDWIASRPAEGVTVVANPEDMRPVLWAAGALLAPFEVGGGTKIKVLEAMAAGAVVIATGATMQGLPAVPGTHYLPAETPEAFAAQAYALTQELGRADALRRHAGDWVRQYDWDALGDRAAEVVASALAS